MKNLFICLLLSMSLASWAQTRFLKISRADSPVSIGFRRIEAGDGAAVGFHLDGTKYFQSGTVQEIGENYIVFKKSGLFGKKRIIPLDSITHIQELMMNMGNGLSVVAVSSLALSGVLVATTFNSQRIYGVLSLGLSAGSFIYTSSLRRKLVKRTLEKYNKVGRDWKVQVVQE
ncbi:MAG: hypothetical protein U0Y10_05155 [Spirosomataceae bacterium]